MKISHAGTGIHAVLDEFAATHAAHDVDGLFALYSDDLVSYSLAPPLQQGPNTPYGTLEGIRAWFGGIRRPRAAHLPRPGREPRRRPRDRPHSHEDDGDTRRSARIDLDLVPLDLRPAPHRRVVAHHAPTRLDAVLHGRLVPRGHRP